MLWKNGTDGRWFKEGIPPKVPLNYGNSGFECVFLFDFSTESDACNDFLPYQSEYRQTNLRGSAQVTRTIHWFVQSRLDLCTAFLELLPQNSPVIELWNFLELLVRKHTAVVTHQYSPQKSRADFNSTISTTYTFYVIHIPCLEVKNVPISIS